MARVEAATCPSIRVALRLILLTQTYVLELVPENVVVPALSAIA